MIAKRDAHSDELVSRHGALPPDRTEHQESDR